ncbi:MAG: 4-(cytidine 5'-diphospho)-2-C-methyl-D-erythritol kinase [Chitinophagaceae bacterium]|nr:4-(cytidine 5'-diphospho)-2-C-methyl-D-erythritol kinase [Chitinophagaceae bacterium]
MILFPNCKINLGLHIMRKRSDGFHDLETVFYPLAVKDILEIVKKDDSELPVELMTTGLAIEGDPAANLCIKAYSLLKQDYPWLTPVQMHLHKLIPIGAGLGGGSSDATHTLLLLNALFELGLSQLQLNTYALQLGSDCAFFLLNKPCFATGRGEPKAEIALDLSGYSFVLVNPGIHINTGWAFSTIIPRNLRPGPKEEQLEDAIQLPVSDWKHHLVNDFERPVFDLYPEIKAIRDILYSEGAVFSGMTGTGSTVFGMFKTTPTLDFLQKYRVINC